MILVDSSVWIDHLRAGDPLLIELLNSNRVLIHPFIVGELACGNLKNRKPILSLLQDLPIVQTATDEEVLFFVERHTLMGLGIGYVDVHLLASVVLDGTAKFWTRDKRLCKAAEAMGLAFKINS
jgi:predicted nucleic acid-binding protein